MQMPSVSLVIPCFNEEARIERMFEGIQQFVTVWESDFEVIIVDDGSTDRSSEFIPNNPVFIALNRKGQIRYIEQENTGKGGALKKGVAISSYDFILTLDADMAAAPIQLLEWLFIRKMFHPHEILIGSRELKTSVISEITYRKFVGNIFNFIIRKATGLSIRDTQCGFKLYPSEIAKILFSILQTKGWAHDVELLVNGNKLGCSIVEMPIIWNAIEGSKIRVLRDSLRMFKDVMEIRKRNKIE